MGTKNKERSLPTKKSSSPISSSSPSLSDSFRFPIIFVYSRLVYFLYSVASGDWWACLSTRGRVRYGSKVLELGVSCRAGTGTSITNNSRSDPFLFHHHHRTLTKMLGSLRRVGAKAPLRVSSYHLSLYSPLADTVEVGRKMSEAVSIHSRVPVCQPIERCTSIRHFMLNGY